jgi:hypothetical protein
MKKLISRHLNESGLSLIQVLMASTAIAGLALVGLRLAEDQKNLAFKTAENYLGEYLTQEIESLLSQPESCSLTLKGLSPSAGTFDVIKRKSKKRSGEEINHLHFPVSEKGSHSYFDSKLEILSYELSQAHISENLKKGMSHLLVEMQIKRDKRKLVKKVPILFVEDGNGRILSCHSGLLNQKTASDKFWKIKDKSIKLSNLKLRVGEKIQSSGQLQVAGELFLEREDMRPCHDLEEGVLKNIKGELSFCRQGRWVAFGLNPIQFQKPKIYEVTLGQNGRKSRKTLGHRYCYLKSQERRNLGDGCKVERLSKSVISEYKITAYTNALATKNICEVACVQ